MTLKPMLTYCALPSRLRHLTSETYEFVINKGHAPLHPFVSFPEKDYGDKGTFGREKSLDFAMRLVSASSQLYLFGISEGTLKEANRAYAENKYIQVHISEFDSDWRTYYPELKLKFGNFLDAMLGKSKLSY